MKRHSLILIALLVGATSYGQNSPDGSGREPGVGVQIGGWNGTTFEYVSVAPGGAMSVAPASGSTYTIVPKGAANYANGQVATSTTAGTLIAARATRRSVTIVNTDATITIYIGAATVTAANGLPLKAGQSIAVDTTALIQVIAASGTPTVAYFETYD